MQYLQSLWKEEDAMGVVEVLLIIVVLIAAVVIFKSQLMTLVTKIWRNINNDASSVYN